MRWVGLYPMLQLSLKVSLTKVISESNESTAPSFQQRLDKADAQIFTLLTYKVCLNSTTVCRCTLKSKFYRLIQTEL